MAPDTPQDLFQNSELQLTPFIFDMQTVLASPDRQQWFSVVDRKCGPPLLNQIYQLTFRHLLNIRNLLKISDFIVIVRIFFLCRVIVISLHILIPLHIITQILVVFNDLLAQGVPLYFPNIYIFMVSLSLNSPVISFSMWLC